MPLIRQPRETDTSNEKSAKDSTVAAHVDEVAQKYKIPCYLEEAKIRALYGFDFHYRATASAQEEAWRKVHEVLQQNRNVSRAIEFAQGDIKEKLDQCIRELDQKQEQRVLHIKYLEDTAAHLLRVLNELDLLTHKDGPADYENLLREIGIIQISRGKLDDSDPTAALILEKNDMLSEIEHELKENRLDLQQASLRLIKLSVRLMDATDAYRKQNL